MGATFEKSARVQGGKVFTKDFINNGKEGEAIKSIKKPFFLWTLFAFLFRMDLKRVSMMKEKQNMTTKKMNKMSWLVALGVGVMLTTGAVAQQMLPTDTEAAQLEDAIAQTTGEFDQMNLGYIHSLGMQQKAWNDPLSHMGEGQLKPGYSRYTWSPDVAGVGID